MGQHFLKSPDMEKSVAHRLNVERAASDLDISVDDLGDAITALETTLRPLLSPERPCEVSKVAPRDTGESPLAEHIKMKDDAIRYAAYRIRDLIERL